MEKDFAKQMLEECEKAEVDVVGEFPVYEMFPYKVRIDAENQEVYLDRKKLPTMCPRTLAETAKNGREKLLKVKFNAQKFADELADALTKREIRMQLKQMFLDNPRIDNNFAYCCSLLCGGILGHPLLERQNRDLLIGWLHCSKEVKMLQLRSLGMAPSRINNYNARHMLRSLSGLMRGCGEKGLLVCIDDMEILMARSSLEPIHYTKMRREDTYESIRQPAIFADTPPAKDIGTDRWRK